MVARRDNSVTSGAAKKASTAVIMTIPEEEGLAAVHETDNAKLIALTIDEESLVNGALKQKSRSMVEVMATLDGDSVNRQSFLRLLPEKWLNDEIMNFFFHLLRVRDRLKCKVANGKRR